MSPEQEQFFNQKYLDRFWIMKRYARIFLHEDQAEEVVQAAFHEAVEKIDIFVSHENPDGWLMVTLKNKINNCRRKNQSDLLRLVSLDSETAQQIAIAENTEEAVEQEESLVSIQKAIQSVLSKEEQYLLKRLIFEHASHKEVASELGITVWSSQKRLERIRNKLRKNFPEYHD